MFVMSVEAQVIKYDNAEDTITTSTSLDTVTFTFQQFNSPMSYELQISADSVSGATDVSCKLELNVDNDGVDWTPIETTVVNGVTTRALETGTFLYGTLRCKCYAPSGTQVTNIRVDLSATSQ